MTIPIHRAFLPSGGAVAKAKVYESRVLEALTAGPLTLTELARAMGYKGISKKLSTTVDTMLRTGTLRHVAGERGRMKLEAAVD